MEDKKHNYHHQFYTRWYAADDEENSWISYLHRNFHHVGGEDVPFTDSSWSFDQEDAYLYDEILKVLYESPDVDASDINVIVVKGRVSLSGIVNSESQISVAQKKVEQIPGVWNVANNLKILSQ